MSSQRAPPETDHAVEIAFTLSDPEYPFVGASAAESCRMELEEMLPRPEGYAEYFRVVGTDPDRILSLAEANELVEPELLQRYDDGGLFEFVVGGGCPAADLAERGAIPTTVCAVEGAGRLEAQVPASRNACDVVDGFLDATPEAEFVAKRQQDRLSSWFSTQDLERTLDEEFTPRQREVLRRAHDSGYYEFPRETTGEELADAMEVSSPTLSQHLRSAERNLVTILSDEELL